MTLTRQLTVAIAILGLSCAGAQRTGSHAEVEDKARAGGIDRGSEGGARDDAHTESIVEPPTGMKESMPADESADSGSAGHGGFDFGTADDHNTVGEYGDGEPAPEARVPPSVHAPRGERDRRHTGGKGGKVGTTRRPRRSSPRPDKKHKARGGIGGSAGTADRTVRPPTESYRPVEKATPPPPRPVQAPALKAGRHDDNRQYNRFLSFLGENSFHAVYPVNIQERLVVHTRDKLGKSLHNCQVKVSNHDGRALAQGTTFADGSTHFFPLDRASARDLSFAVNATCAGKTRNGQLARGGKRATELRFNFERTVAKRVPVDIAIVLDTTGSMQSQIDRLKSTLKAIHFQLTQLSTRPDVRFGLVAYRDRDDEYLTKVSPFTGDVKAFQHVLNKLDADGGGDTPEDLQAALDDAMHKLEWRNNALRLGFIVSDAIPHTDYGQKYDYRELMREGLERGIKWTTVGAGGLGRDGEVIFRQIAQFTMGEYVFITEGGTGDSEGSVVEASHHVGSNYKTENLDQAILRIVRRELSYLTNLPKDFDYTIVAQGTKATPRSKVLAPAVAELVRQLHDYSSMRLSTKTPVAIVPVLASDDSYKDVGGYLTDQMVLSASRYPAFRLVERDLQKISDEVKFQLSDLVDVEQAVPLGKMLGAELIIVAKLTVTGEQADLYAKLVRVETAEILSVAKVDLVGGVIHGS